MEDMRNTVEGRLAASMKRLAVKMPFEKITIKQLTDGAGVIRVTFYNHFRDKYDLLEWIVKTEILDSARNLISNKMFREAVVLIFANMQKDKEFYMHVVNMEGQNSFSEIVDSAIQSLLLSLLNEEGVRKNFAYEWMKPEYVAAYYAKAMSYVVIMWIRMGMKFDPEEMGRVYEYMTTRSFWDIIEGMQEE
ncbi:MAG: TetR/AcrR family transcriptional regulator C-terminal domain-containing protein [Lachnospiraceae bacterium]|nr:TetR/AcrR family transcriptional regulator C-terminal domain-containing protein [Lachnospiraceae bacterium]